MIVGSIKEDLALEKRVSLTPETAKNLIGLGLKVCIEQNYASHLVIDDKIVKEKSLKINIIYIDEVDIKKYLYQGKQIPVYH